MVPKASVVRMLLDRHQLDTVVATACDVRKHIVCEVSVLGYLALFRTHPNVCLVDLQTFWFRSRTRVLEDMVLACRWIEKDSII